jgi:hypothetical protein
VPCLEWTCVNLLVHKNYYFGLFPNSRTYMTLYAILSLLTYAASRLRTIATDPNGTLMPGLMQRTHRLYDCPRHGVALCALEKSATPHARENLNKFADYTKIKQAN